MLKKAEHYGAFGKAKNCQEVAKCLQRLDLEMSFVLNFVPSAKE